MVLYKGYDTHVRYISETSYATGGTIGTAIGGKITNFSPNINNNLIRTQGIGEGRNASQTLYGNFECSGSIEWEIADFTFLQYGVGIRSGSGTTASKYAITEANDIDYTNMETFKMEAASEGSTDDVDVYTGCSLVDWSISGTEGEIIKAAANYVAQKPTSSTSVTGSYTADTQKPWMFWQGTLSYGASPSAVAFVTSFNVTSNNNSVPIRGMGSRLIADIKLGIRTYDFTITVRMSDTIATTLRDDLYGQANSPIDDPSIANPIESNELRIALTEGSASGDRNATIYLDEVNINDMNKPVVLSDGIVEVTFNGYARKAGNSAKLIEWYTTT